MIRKHFLIDKRQLAKLKRIKKKTGAPLSESVRRAIDSLREDRVRYVGNSK
jgi:hypothetical protein